MSSLQPRPSTYSRYSRSIGALLLLSVWTSLAFNRAVLSRERSEQRRLHQLQMSLLQQISHEASPSASLLRAPSLSHSLEEQKKLARRLRTLQLDPLRLGFSPVVLPSAEEEAKLQKAREASTSWGQAIFGSGTAQKLKDSVVKTRQSIREKMFGMSESTEVEMPNTDDEDEAWLRGEWTLCNSTKVSSFVFTLNNSSELERSLEDGETNAKERREGANLSERASSPSVRPGSSPSQTSQTTRQEDLVRDQPAEEVFQEANDPISRNRDGHRRVYM